MSAAGDIIDLRDIVRNLGGDLYAGGRRATIPGPGHSRRDRSLSLSLTGDGSRVLWQSFASDLRHPEVMDYLGIEPDASAKATPAERAKERALRTYERRKREQADRALCQHIWGGVERIDGGPVEAYLWGRGLVADGISDIGYHPAAPRFKEPKDGQPIPTHPAMVALVRDAAGRAQALHLTYLKPDGSGKAFGDRSRLMFGAVAGCAVHLGQPSDGVLAVGEGIETCGAYSTLKGITTWAALSTSGLKNFVLPTQIKRLIIAADADKGGLDAAYALGERARRRCDVEIHPAPEGQDWSDVLQAGANG